VYSPLNRSVFGGESKGIPPHRMKYPISLHPLDSGDYIRNRVVADMSHVQVSRWIGEHRQGIEFGLVALCRGPIYTLLGPSFLPMRLYLGRVVTGLHGYTPIGLAIIASASVFLHISGLRMWDESLPYVRYCSARCMRSRLYYLLYYVNF
jgi:hypothetical protein